MVSSIRELSYYVFCLLDWFVGRAHGRLLDLITASHWRGWAGMGKDAHFGPRKPQGPTHSDFRSTTVAKQVRSAARA
jgi:hypothetical protein